MTGLHDSQSVDPHASTLPQSQQPTYGAAPQQQSHPIQPAEQQPGPLSPSQQTYHSPPVQTYSQQLSSHAAPQGQYQPQPPQSPQSLQSPQSPQSTHYAPPAQVQQPIVQGQPTQSMYQHQPGMVLTTAQVPSVPQPVYVVHQQMPNQGQAQQQNSALHHQTGMPPSQQHVNNVNVSSAQKPAESKIENDSCCGDVGIFLFGFITSLVISFLAFIFVCVARSLGLTDRRRKLLFWGVTTGVSLGLIAYIATIVAASSG